MGQWGSKTVVENEIMGAMWTKANCLPLKGPHVTSEKATIFKILLKFQNKLSYTLECLSPLPPTLRRTSSLSNIFTWLAIAGSENITNQ